MTLQIERDLKYSIDRPFNRCVTPKYLSIVKEKATAAITKKNTLYSFRNCLIYWSIMLDLQYARVHYCYLSQYVIQCLSNGHILPINISTPNLFPTIDPLLSLQTWLHSGETYSV